MWSTALQIGQQTTGVVATNEFLELWMAFLDFTTSGMIRSVFKFLAPCLQKLDKFTTDGKTFSGSSIHP